MSTQREIVERFHRLYYDSRVWLRTFWLGVPTQKCPFDLWIYQELIFDLRPDLIIETGTANGGSALFLASACDLIGHGKVVTIDVDDTPVRPRHKRITYLLGSSTSEEVLAKVKRRLGRSGRALVILDSDHSRAHVLEELRRYGALVPAGSYVIVEDTNVNGHPVLPEFGPGPMEAVQEFLKGNDGFVVDDAMEKLFMTFNPRGYLRRVK